MSGGRVPLPFLCAAALTAATGCAHRPTDAPSAGDRGFGAGFARLVDDYFDAKFAFEPSAGTAAGLHQYDGRLEDLSRARIAARVAELVSFIARFEALDRTRLSLDDAVDAEALEHQARAELLDLAVLRTLERNPMRYVSLPGEAVDGLVKRSFAPPAERLRAVVRRLEAIPAVHAAARANVALPPRELTLLALRMAKGSIGFFESDVATWARGAAGGEATLLASFEAANAKVVASAREVVRWLEKDLLPRSTGRTAIGAEHFLAKLRHEERVELPLDALLAKGEAQLSRDLEAFVATSRRIDPAKTPAEVMRTLSDEHPAADDLVPSVARSVEDARRFLIDRGLVSLPSEVRPRIEETPPYARAGTFASMDAPGPYETKATEAFYYVTPVEKDWDARRREEHLRLYNPYVVAMINVHEAYPGHYTQFLYSPSFPTKTRKLVSAASNAEGWAHYAEQMMVDEGFGGGDPKMRLAQLQEALLRDCRYVVGIKLHTQGMTVEQGAKVFEDKAFQEPANAYEESRRGVYNPTYLIYTLGKLMIYELREELRAARGWTPRQFHDAFVAQGSLPVPLVRKLLLRP